MDGCMERSVDPCAVLDLRVMENWAVVSPPTSSVHGAVNFMLDSMFQHAQGEVDCQMVLDLLGSGGVEFHVDYVLEYFQKVEQGGVSSLGDQVGDRGHVRVVP